MEDEDIPSGERSGVNSFCGGFSLKNPRNLFQSDNSYRVATNKYVRNILY